MQLCGDYIALDMVIGVSTPSFYYRSDILNLGSATKVML